MQSTNRILMITILALAVGKLTLSSRDAVAQAKAARPPVVPSGGATVPRPAVPNAGQAPLTANGTGNGPNGNPNASNFGSRNEFGRNRNRNQTGNQNSSIPLGNLGFGNLYNSPWFLPFGAYGGYGFNGSGYGSLGYGVNSGLGYGVNNGLGYGSYDYDNLAGSGLYDSNNGGAADNTTANNAEQERQVLENAKTSNSLYYQFRENNRADRARQAVRERGTPEAVAKAQLDNVPRGLGSDELNQTTGEITWPTPLSHDEYSKLRAAIEEQFRVRSQNDAAEGTMIIKQNIQLMVDLLRTQIEDMPAAEFMTARKFLNSLDYAVHKTASR